MSTSIGLAILLSGAATATQPSRTTYLLLVGALLLLADRAFLRRSRARQLIEVLGAALALTALMFLFL